MMMMLNSGTLVIPIIRPPKRSFCKASSSTVNTDQLRTQLDQLHSEAQNTRSKANNARLRLMRLSETAEKLRRQAALSVQSGKENDARDLLFQKKKVMQALEKSKSRIDLYDELCTKLNEAISIKESQLVGTVASDLEPRTEISISPVRIVSPVPESTENLNEGETFVAKELILGDDEKLQSSKENQTDHDLNNEPGDSEKLDDDVVVSNVWEISSYKEFLEHLDQQLNNMEIEIATVLRFSTLILQSQEKPKNPKVEQTVEILESVRGIRMRIQEWRRQKQSLDISSS